MSTWLDSHTWDIALLLIGFLIGREVRLWSKR